MNHNTTPTYVPTASLFASAFDGRQSGAYRTVFFCFVFCYPPADGENKSLSSPHSHVFSCVSCVNLTQSPSQSSASWCILRLSVQRQRGLSLPSLSTTATAAGGAAVVYGYLSVSTRLDPLGPGAVEIATPKIIPPGSVRLAQIHRKHPPPGHGKTASVRRPTGQAMPWSKASSLLPPGTCLHFSRA